MTQMTQMAQFRAVSPAAEGREREAKYPEGESHRDSRLSPSGYFVSRIPRVFDPRWAHSHLRYLRHLWIAF
jgi:hypothetical protein